MKSDQKNVWLAMAIIIAMFVGWQFFYELPRIQQEQEAQQRQEELSAGNTDDATLPELGGVDDAFVLELGDLHSRTTAGMQNPFMILQAPQHLDQNVAIAFIRRSHEDLGHFPVSLPQPFAPRAPDIRHPARLPGYLVTTARG